MSPSERAHALNDAAVHRRVLELLAEAREGLEQLPARGSDPLMIRERIDLLLQLAIVELGGAAASTASEGPRVVVREGFVHCSHCGALLTDRGERVGCHLFDCPSEKRS